MADVNRASLVRAFAAALDARAWRMARARSLTVALASALLLTWSSTAAEQTDGANGVPSTGAAPDALQAEGPAAGTRDAFEPPEPLPKASLRAPLVVDGKATRALRGALLFRAPEILGEEARQKGVSCQTCHPNGGRNPNVVVAGASPAPGVVDLTRGRFGADDDGVANPVVVPTLRALDARAHLFVARPTTDLASGISDHLTLDLGGAGLDDEDLAGLVRYVSSFGALDHPLLDARGRLTASAPAVVKRGETLFVRAEAALSSRSCATCHVPDGAFLDGRRWPNRVDGRLVRTPSLLDLSERGPFFIDGRAATLLAVVDDYASRHGLTYTTADKDALVAYLRAVGGERATEESSVRRALSEAANTLLLVDDPRSSPETCGLVVGALERVLGERPPPPRVAFKVEGVRARVAQLGRACAAPGARGTSFVDAARLADDLARLANEWEDAARAR